MQKPEWEHTLPAGYRMATEADRGARIGEDWKAWGDHEWVSVPPGVPGTPLMPHKEDLSLGKRWCHVPMCIPIRGDVGDGYRELDPLEGVIQDSGSVQQVLWCGTWEPIAGTIGCTTIPTPYAAAKAKNWTIRVPVEVPSTYPPLSQEAKDSVDQFHEDALGMVDRVVAVSQEDKELGYAGPGASLEDMESDCPTYNAAGTHVTIPVTHPWVPKPFTPNKYTRWMPTLDGRKVPVDVYCVLAAFPTGSAAVDHAVKKQLAPGQRGHKDRIQDLKEARASLTRAIELEEAVQG